MVPVPIGGVTVRLITNHELGKHVRNRCRPFPLAHEKTATARDVSRVGVWGGLRGLHRPPRRPVSSGARGRARAGQTLVRRRCEADGRSNSRGRQSRDHRAKPPRACRQGYREPPNTSCAHPPPSAAPAHRPERPGTSLSSPATSPSS
jgi:hypothetical protein